MQFNAIANWSNPCNIQDKRHPNDSALQHPVPQLHEFCPLDSTHPNLASTPQLVWKFLYLSSSQCLWLWLYFAVCVVCIPSVSVASHSNHHLWRGNTAFKRKVNKYTTHIYFQIHISYSIGIYVVLSCTETFLYIKVHFAM